MHPVSRTESRSALGGGEPREPEPTSFRLGHVLGKMCVWRSTFITPDMVESAISGESAGYSVPSMPRVGSAPSAMGTLSGCQRHAHRVLAPCCLAASQLHPSSKEDILALKSNF